ncbi:MAG: AMP-binding protein, partial [Deltaproteobacteria bacterium]|nr:AMP-binding protein [Deltaproteobacteria bacterium]
LDQSDAKAVIYSDMFHTVISSIRDQHPKVAHYICHSEKEIKETVQYDALLAKCSPQEPLVYVQDDDPAFIMYTSGTTGKPKGAVLTHKNLLVEVIDILLENDIKKGDRSLFSAPLFHVAALVHMLLIFYLGGSSVIMDKFEPRDFLKLIEREKIAFGMLIPAMWIFLLQEPGISEYDTRSLRNVGTGGAVLPVEVMRKAMQAFPNVGIYNLFGQTETSSCTTLLYPEHAFSKEGSVGRRIVNLEARIVDGEDNDVAVGQVGEIIYRGPTIMKEYYNNPEATADAIREGWFHSGDLVREDEDGFIWVVDRKKDMIISGGENIYPAEVEEVLFTHPKIVEAAVIGVPDPQWGESVKAIVVLQKGETLTAEEIIGHCKTHMASYKKPKTVEFVEGLPRNSAGKVRKFELRKKYASQRAIS